MSYIRKYNGIEINPPHTIGGTSFTSTTAENIIDSVLVPANTFKLYDVFGVEARVRKIGTSGNYQLVKKRKGEITSLQIRIEPTEERHKEGHIDDLAKKIENGIFTILNLRIPVEVVKPGSLPRSEGKAKRIVEE